MLDVLKEKCTGCGACAAVCPENCISMQPDKEGFLYPHIDETSCIKCGLCERKCHALKNVRSGIAAPKAYVAYNNNDNERRLSSSGGMFVLFAKRIINDGGAVYGVALNKQLAAEHIRVDRIEELSRLQTSKYVQSKTGTEIFARVLNDLKSGTAVLYSGTPCQIGALKAFLGKDYPNLKTVSFICHGVPSPAVWKEYVNWQKNKKHSEILNANFRDKYYGWTEFSLKLDFENKSVYRKKLTDDYYLKCFLNNLCLRPTCHSCSYKGKENLGFIDIIMADWWGSQRGILPCSEDDKGLSSVIINSDKGETLFDAIKSDITFSAYDFEKIINTNASYSLSSTPSKHRAQFMEEIFVNPFDKTVKKYAKTPFTVALKRKIFKVLYAIAKKTGIVALKRKLSKQ